MEWMKKMFNGKKQVDDPEVDTFELHDAGVKVDKEKYKQGFGLRDLTPAQQKKLKDYRKN